LDTIRDRTKLVLFTDRKTRKGFPLAGKSVTLNDLEPRNGRYFALCHWIRQLRQWRKSGRS